MKEVEALFKFNDLKENVMREVGDVFYCDETRYEFLKKHNAVRLVEKKPKKDEVLEENGFFENEAEQTEIKDAEPVKKPKKKKKVDE